MKNIPILSYLTRYWLILALTAGAAALMLNDAAFRSAGTLVYAPALGFEAVVLALLVLHLFFPKTLDLDIHSGFFANAWPTLTARERIFGVLFILAVLFLGFCWIAAALAK